MAARWPSTCSKANTADQNTLSTQVDKIRRCFKLSRVAMVGDRGVLTSARIEKHCASGAHSNGCAVEPWAACALPPSTGSARLRAPATKQLAAEGGPLQLSLFDDREMAQISALEESLEKETERDGSLGRQ